MWECNVYTSIAANQIIHQISSRLDPRYNDCTVETNTVADGKLYVFRNTSEKLGE